jgi:uncharacterized protein YcfJ
MNKSIITAAGIVCAVAAAGFASSQFAKKSPTFAQVVAVTPVNETTTQPVQECEDVVVHVRRRVQDRDRIGGTIVGGVIGGAVGHSLVGGRAQGLATVAGAVAGGYAGNQVQKSMQDNDTYATTKQRCQTVMKAVERVIGYEVKYLLDGQLGAVRMDHDPGAAIPVQNGQLLLTRAALPTR